MPLLRPCSRAANEGEDFYEARFPSAAAHHDSARRRCRHRCSGKRSGHSASRAAARDSAAEAANALRTIEGDLAGVQDKLEAAKQVLARTEIRAPVSGTVVGLRPTTVGGVIQPGEALLDVVPNGGRLIVVASISPRDADNLEVGQTARVRFDASGARDAPVVEGKVQKFSADALTDAKTGATYFEAEVGVGEKEKRSLPSELLRPGVPATVMIKTGERTVLGYLFAPILRARFNALREK